MPTFTLSARSSFIFDSVIHSHGWYQLAPFAWDADKQVFRTTERLTTGRVVALEIVGRAKGVSVTTPRPVGKRETAEITANVRWMFGLDANFSEFYALADAEPRLAHCRAQASGRLLRSMNLWDDVVKRL